VPREIKSTIGDVNVFDDLVDEFTPYHKSRPSRADGVPAERREFVAWDGEGINLRGPGKPQSYVLFGCSTGDYILSEDHLSVFDCIDLMLEVGEKNPQAIHVGYSFNYDANQIVRTLFDGTLKQLHKEGHVTISRPAPNKFGYRIEWRSGKWFQVTRFGKNYDAKNNPNNKLTVRIYDLFSFFGSSFIAAYTQNVGPIPDVVEQGKARRNDFDQLTAEYVETYWKAEIICIRELAEELRRRLYGAGLRITQWHGPGALASYALRENHIKEHLGKSPDAVREAARFAYAGGRFEMFSLGREHGKIYSMDINSAYPHGIRQLPTLNGGNWKHVDGSTILERRSFAQFGVYHIRLLHRADVPLFRPDPSPVFHRDQLGNISYPWKVTGWYWSPEAHSVVKARYADYEIVEGWEYEPPNDSQPFAWVEDMYNTRREWKAKGYPTQLALKLCLNSLYGKMAQRVGWNQETKESPTWHQLEWAGWVTSNCRAMLWDVMRKIPYRSLIAVETDGLYTTTNPAELGIHNSGELGGWEVEEYDEILYVQSGMAWLRKGTQWTCKRRGLDKSTFSLSDCENYLRTLGPQEKWLPFVGKTTRFIGIGAALASSAPTKTRLGVWETSLKDIQPGQIGKRLHMWGQCLACSDGRSAYDGRHDMMINPAAYRDPMSAPHDIPWEGEVEAYRWRERQQREEVDLITHRGGVHG
jgi:hypothetical protein